MHWCKKLNSQSCIWFENDSGYFLADFCVLKNGKNSSCSLTIIFVIRTVTSEILTVIAKKGGVQENDKLGKKNRYVGLKLN